MHLVRREKSAARNPSGGPVRARLSIIQFLTRTRRYIPVGALGGRGRGILKYYILLNYLLSQGGASGDRPLAHAASGHPGDAGG